MEKENKTLGKLGCEGIGVCVWEGGKKDWGSRPQNTFGPWRLIRFRITRLCIKHETVSFVWGRNYEYKKKEIKKIVAWKRKSGSRRKIGMLLEGGRWLRLRAVCKQVKWSRKQMKDRKKDNNFEKKKKANKKRPKKCEPESIVDVQSPGFGGKRIEANGNGRQNK